MRWLAATLLTVAALGAMGFVLMHESAPDPDRVTRVAHELLDEGKPVEALELLQEVSTEVMPQEEQDAVEIQARAELRDIFTLSSLYDRKPDAVMENERASQLVARTAVVMQDDDTVDRIEQRWAEETKAPHAWLCLKADRLLSEGRIDEARELLESKEFSGADDAGRLTRLAMLSADGDLKQALKLLDKAVAKAPKSGDARSFRGQVLESLGRLKEARVEYVAATAAEPTNPFYRLQLAEFYQRRGNYYLALDTWEDTVEVDGGDVAWVKLLFWSRVANPRTETLPVDVTLTGRNQSLAHVMQQTPGDRFWDEDTFTAQVDSAVLNRTSQEVYWLRLLEHLRDGDSVAARELMDGNRFRNNSWNALLEDSLASLLNYRETGHLLAADLSSHGAGDVHPFITQLLDPHQDIDVEFGLFLESKEAVPAVLLACGWMEAALKMPCETICPNDAPHYLAYAMCQAYRSNRTPDEAITFAMQQNASPEIDVMLGEMQYTNGDKDAAVATWRLAANDSGAAGYRAAWLLGVELISRGRIGEAETVISEHPDLSQATAGRELLARIALLRGDVDGAAEIYDSIRDTSLQARVFEIRRRLVAGDYDEARALAEQLLAVHPDAPSVRKLVVDLNTALESQARNTTASAGDST